MHMWLNLRLNRQLQTIGVVTLITLLIWVYAEAQHVQSRVREVPLRFATASSQYVVEPREMMVRVVFQGASSQIGRLMEALNRTRGGLTITLDVDPDEAQQSRQTVFLADQIASAVVADNLTVNDYGVSVVAVDPPTVEVAIDKLVSRTVPVFFQPEDVQLSSRTVNPSQVTVTMPEALLNDLMTSPDALYAEAEPNVPLKSLEKGIEQTVQAQVKLPPPLQQRNVEVSPEVVDVTFTIAKVQESVTVPLVPVWATAPPSELHRFDIQLAENSQFIPDVKITGPSELIQRVREGKIPVIATFRLSTDELERGVGSAPIRFELPPELTVTAPTNTVNFTITRRNG